MMYDKSDCCVKLRKFTSVHLAWWHNYKWACKKVFEVFGNDFIAGLFHTLFPSVNFNMKFMSHTSINTYLTYIRLAYPSFRDQLAAALQNVDLPISSKTVLLNLQSLCEFFIPAVVTTVFVYTHVMVMMLCFFFC